MQGELIKAERDGNALNITAKIFDSDSVLDKVAGLSGKEISITISKPREKRSLNSNDYFWCLARGLAEAIHGNATEETLHAVYMQLLRQYGQCVVVTVRSTCDISKLGWRYFDRFKDGLIAGKEYTAYKVYIGSSQYTQEQMSKLIDGTREECKKYGVKTELDDYADLMYK
jgi:hypothetical protein